MEAQAYTFCTKAWFSNYIACKSAAAVEACCSTDDTDITETLTSSKLLAFSFYLAKECLVIVLQPGRLVFPNGVPAGFKCQINGGTDA